MSRILPHESIPGDRHWKGEVVFPLVWLTWIVELSCCWPFFPTVRRRHIYSWKRAWPTHKGKHSVKVGKIKKGARPQSIPLDFLGLGFPRHWSFMCWFGKNFNWKPMLFQLYVIIIITNMWKNPIFCWKSLFETMYYSRLWVRRDTSKRLFSAFRQLLICL